MRTRSLRRPTVIAAVGTVILFTGIPVAAASSPSPVVTNPHIVANFDFAAGQTPEDVAVEPGGAVDISMASANNVVRLEPDGSTTVLAQFPTTGSCGILRGPSTLGLVRSWDGSVYFVECSGDANQGVWRLTAGHAPVQVARLPADGFPNGLALDPATGDLYVTDSALGEVWKIPADGAPAAVWVSGPAFQPVGLIGAIGISVHNDSVWVGNSGAGTILRVPIEPDGTAGPVQTAVSGLTSETGKIDVVGPDNTIILPLVVANEVASVQPGGQPQVLLTGTDGLQNPTSVTVYDGRLYVTSGAYLTSQDPNLLVADYCE